jgi:hypothetical protein
MAEKVPFVPDVFSKLKRPVAIAIILPAAPRRRHDRCPKIGESLMDHSFLRSAGLCFAPIALALAAVGNAAAVSISYSDETFHNADWSMQVLFENYISQSFSAGQEPTGGMPDEFRRNHMFGSETTNNGGIGPAGATIGHFWNDASWNPSTQGEVDGILFRADGVAFDDRPAGQTVPTGVIVAMGFVLRQAGVVYVRNPSTNVSGPNSVWQELSFNATAATAFTRFDEQPGHPDFSTSGGPIDFGYYTRAGAFVPAMNNDFGFDNFEITISTPVPEPSSAVLLVMGAILVRYLIARPTGPYGRSQFVRCRECILSPTRRVEC